MYIDNVVDETSLVRSNQYNHFNNKNLTNINSFTLNTQAVSDNQVIIKASVDQFHDDNERHRRDLGLDFYNESNDLVKNNHDKDIKEKKLTILDSISVNGDPVSENESANKKYVDDRIGADNNLRFNQSEDNNLKVFVGNDVYNLLK